MAFANGPYNVEIQKGIDGIMSESKPGCLAQFAYICLAKPLMILTCGADLQRFEETLKACLKYGAFPDVRDHLTMTPRINLSAEEKNMYDRYLPLLEELRGRRWVFHPHAVDLPCGYDGNIFQNRDGRYVVTFFPISASRLDRNNRVERRIALRLPGVPKTQDVDWLSAERPEERRSLPAVHSNNDLYLVFVDEYTDASVLVI